MTDQAETYDWRSSDGDAGDSLSLQPVFDIHTQLFDVAEALPPLPGSVVQLASTVADDDSDLDDVVAIVREDPGLATALLAEANSAASGSSSEIVTIEAALVRLGLARTLALSCSKTVGPQAIKALNAYQLPAGGLWRHSVVASYVAEATFRLLRGSVGPEVVTSTLLHDIGRVVVNDVIDPEPFAKIAEHMTIEAAERELLDADHAEVGGLLLEMWGVPTSITEAVGAHHSPSYARDDPATVVSLASAIANQLEPQSVGVHDANEIERLAFALGLDLDLIMSKSRQLLEAAGHAHLG